MHPLLLLIAAPVFLFSGATLAADENVLKLDNNNLKSSITEKGHLCVLFHATFSGSEPLMEQFKAAATSLKKDNSIISLGTFNVNDHKELAKEYGIDETNIPMLVYFRAQMEPLKKPVKDQKDSIKKDDIIAWLNENKNKVKKQ